MIKNKQEKVIGMLEDKYTNRPRAEAVNMLNKELGTTTEISSNIYNNWRKKYVCSIKG